MQDKITIADTPDCLNTNDRAMWVLGYQAALAARSTCLYQIQVPSVAEQAAWHAGLDEGRAQAGFTVSNAEAPQAAPAAVAVPDGLKLVPVDLTPEMKREFMDLLMDGIDIYVNRRDQIEIQTDAPRRIWKAVLALAPSAPADALATATGLPAQAVEMPDFDLRTSKGGRGFVAWYFANVLQRYDYENYITNKLAADFACDLAKALNSTLAAPQAQADARDAGDTCAACFFEGSCEHQAIQQKADRYDFIVSKKLILSGGTEQFGWPIAPFGSECDRYIDAAIAAAKGEQQ